MVRGTVATADSDVEVWWDLDGSPQLLAMLRENEGYYVGYLNVPADSADGTYAVGLHHTTSETMLCLTFTVGAAVQTDAGAAVQTDAGAAVQTDAYTPAIAAQGETPSVLPSTGLMLLVPAAGLASAAAGAAMFRRRRQ